MTIARFSVAGWESYGRVEGDRVRVIQGDIFGEHKEAGASYPLDRVKLLPPTRPTAFWAVGLNYEAHIAHQEVALDPERIKRESQGFRPWHKGVHCMIGQDDAVVIPGDITLTSAPNKVERINAGDVIEVENPGIGCLRNPVVGEKWPDRATSSFIPRTLFSHR